MRNLHQLLNEVAQTVSPADKEFVALHKVETKQFVNHPHHQFKGGTKKDMSKLAHPSNETGMETELEKEKKTVEEAFDLTESEHMRDAIAAQTKAQAAKSGTERDEHQKTYHKHMAAHFELQAQVGKTDTMRDKATKLRAHHEAKAKNLNHISEETEQLDELSKKTLGSYIEKASTKMAMSMADFGKTNARGEDEAARKNVSSAAKRQGGIKVAVKKLTKEDLDEMSFDDLAEHNLHEISKKTLGSYIKSASADRTTRTQVATATRQYAGQDSREGRHDDAKQWTKLADDHGKKADKRGDGIRTAVDKLTKEDMDDLQELSKKTLGAYVKGAVTSKEHLKRRADRRSSEAMSTRDDKKSDNLFAASQKAHDKANKRGDGVNRAVDKLTKEDMDDLQEISKKTLGSYIDKATGEARSLKKDSRKLAAAGAYDAAEKLAPRIRKRIVGSAKANDKMVSESATFRSLMANLSEAKIEGPYAHAYHAAKETLHKDWHPKLAHAFSAMNQGGDEHEELERHGLHKLDTLKPILKKHGIAQD